MFVLTLSMLVSIVSRCCQDLITITVIILIISVIIIINVLIIIIKTCKCFLMVLTTMVLSRTKETIGKMMLQKLVNQSM